MGHEIHFLERLGRANAEQADTTMFLYKNRESLKFLLERVKLPPGTERVAISLDSANQGPFVIVSTDGHFVTCLGENMTPGDTFQIPFLQFRHHLDQYNDFRLHQQRYEQLSEEGILDELYEDLREQGDELSRESFRGLVAIQPVIKEMMLRLYFEYCRVLTEDSYPTLLQFKKFHKKNENLLRKHWNLTWAMVNLFMLFCVNGRRGIERELKDLLKRGLFSQPVFFQGELIMTYRAIWATGQVGGMLLPYLKKAIRHADSCTDWLHAFTGLLVLGHRDPSEMPSISELIVDLTKTDEMTRNILGLILGYDQEILIRCMLDPDGCIQDNTALARRIFFSHFQPPFREPYNFDSPEDMPADLANSTLANSGGSYLENPRLLPHLLKMIPWLARASAEDLFLPAEFLKRFYSPWTPQSMMSIIQGWRKVHLPNPRQAKPQVGRNDPCPCGSGKKYKRCCAGH